MDEDHTNAARSGTPGAAPKTTNPKPWIFVRDGALAAALEAAESPADAHHRLFAVMATAGALERINEAQEVGVQGCNSDKGYPRDV